MVEVETYNNRVDLYPLEKDIENTRLRLSDKNAKTDSDSQEVIKQSNSRLTLTRKIRRTKSAGIF